MRNCGIGEIPVVKWMFLQRYDQIHIRGDLEDLIILRWAKKITVHSQFLSRRERKIQDPLQPSAGVTVQHKKLLPMGVDQNSPPGSVEVDAGRFATRWQSSGTYQKIANTIALLSSPSCDAGEKWSSHDLRHGIAHSTFMLRHFRYSLKVSSRTQ